MKVIKFLWELVKGVALAFLVWSVININHAQYLMWENQETIYNKLMEVAEKLIVF